jgi:protein Mpv17
MSLRSRFLLISLFSIFTNVLHVTQWWSFIPKVVVDQTIWGTIWNNTYILMLGLMKLESGKNIWSDMKRSTIPLFISGLRLWPLAHCVTYGLLPVENRLVWVDLVEILWVTILATQAAAFSKQHEESSASVEEPATIVEAVSSLKK